MNGGGIKVCRRQESSFAKLLILSVASGAVRTVPGRTLIMKPFHFCQGWYFDVPWPRKIEQKDFVHGQSKPNYHYLLITINGS